MKSFEQRFFEQAKSVFESWNNSTQKWLTIYLLVGLIAGLVLGWAMWGRTSNRYEITCQAVKDSNGNLYLPLHVR